MRTPELFSDPLVAECIPRRVLLGSGRSEKRPDPLGERTRADGGVGWDERAGQ